MTEEDSNTLVEFSERMDSERAQRGFDRLHANVFTCIENEFRCPAKPSDVLLHAGALGNGAPAEAIDARQARRILSDPATESAISDAILSTLLRRVQREPRAWQRIALWVMLPGLKAITGRLYRAWRTDLDDVRADVIVGFFEAMRRTSPDRHALGAKLWWTTFRIARNACAQAIHEKAYADVELVATQSAYDHSVESSTGPVAADVIDIADHPAAYGRVEGERLGAIAKRHGLRESIRKQRRSPVRSLDYRWRPGRVRGAPSDRGYAVSARGNGEGDAA
ncbi:hypothetical protein EV191_11086 [Tamaricihabitans halophyticus]|uniref:Uncharacterized protein n=1 Tax=Tamaricihabitans halophyticus TaxID=1262583 RepID=A0A4R2QID3_9PSEU|nr:hypothetical protein [Tamaricihabitans halophyticus]TCP48529.1 hypothetical protein EV191_11086 [Tamaricihabitans halophyticus]